MYKLPNPENPYSLTEKELVNLSNKEGLQELLKQEQEQLKRYNNSFDRESLKIKIAWLIKRIQEA